MEGINFLTDHKNRKIAVQIDLTKYGEIWQSFYDRLLIEQRKNEESTSFDSFLESLKEDGLIDG